MSYVSSLHKGTTKVWFGATQVNVDRDPRTGLIACPCGEFEHKSAEKVRLHANNTHKRSVVTGVHAISTASSSKSVRASDIWNAYNTPSTRSPIALPSRSGISTVDSVEKLKGSSFYRNPSLLSAPLRRIGPSGKETTKPAGTFESDYQLARTKRKADEELSRPSPTPLKVPRMSGSLSITDSTSIIAQHDIPVIPRHIGRVQKDPTSTGPPQPVASTSRQLSVPLPRSSLPAGASPSPRSNLPRRSVVSGRISSALSQKAVRCFVCRNLTLETLCTGCKSKQEGSSNASSFSPVDPPSPQLLHKLPTPALDSDHGSGTKKMKRVTKQQRQKEFAAWLAKWKAGRRGRKLADDKTDWWRVETTRNQGGKVYSTPQELFSALQDAVKQHESQLNVSGGVLDFYGCYSIIAQPKINVEKRRDKVREQLEAIGLRVDAARMGHCLFKYKNAQISTTDYVYKYPCPCGGTPLPRPDERRQPHRLPDKRYAGEQCGGTAMIIIGDDNALLSYAIRGQRIAVDIVH